ncbi:MAG: hypothetical protein WC783_01060 [Candidatus Paceibacterota bacterium]|jgi:hypothetical protein
MIKRFGDMDYLDIFTIIDEDQFIGHTFLKTGDDYVIDLKTIDDIDIDDFDMECEVIGHLNSNGQVVQPKPVFKRR